MNRLLVAVALSLTTFGCAVGAEDPAPEPTPQEPQRDPPQQALSGDLQDPLANATQDISDHNRPPALAPLQEGPMPEPGH